MGAGQSKEEALYQAVINSNHQAVKTLRRDGASLECPDKEGRTPLILACTRGDLYDMVITLLNEGAKLDAYRTGPHGGYPLHHAAKRGLDKTVLLLLSRGANPLAVNDEGLTPLDMARNKAHVSVVRIIEDKICLFSGMVRELSGPGFLEAIVPQLVTKRVFVYVLPTESDPRKLPRNELVIYQNPRVPIPRTVISLAKAEVEEPRFNHHDPTLVITAIDKTAKVRFKFMSENEGDKAQLERFYKACARGIRQVPHAQIIRGLQDLLSEVLYRCAWYGLMATWTSASQFLRRRLTRGGWTDSGPPAPPALSSTQGATQGLQALNRPAAPQLSSPTTPPNPPSQSKPTTPTSSSSGTPTGQPSRSSSLPPTEPIPDEIALALAINASILSASEEGVPVSPSAQRSSSWDGGRGNRGPSDKRNVDTVNFGDWVEGEHSSYSGWGPGSNAGAGPSRLGPSVSDNPSTSNSGENGSPQPTPSPTSGLTSSSSVTVVASPSAPPAPSAPPLPLDGPIHYPSVDTSPVQVDYASAAESSEASLAKQKAEDKSGGQCVVCWDAPAEAVCIPCGHLAGCMDCLTEIKSKDWGCPVCRASIQQVIKVYAV
ncbi:unnamed protein product [Calypogeia fissa]